MEHAKTTRSHQIGWREPGQRAASIMHTWHAESVGRLVTLEVEQATRLGRKDTVSPAFCGSHQRMPVHAAFVGYVLTEAVIF